MNTERPRQSRMTRLLVVVTAIALTTVSCARKDVLDGPQTVRDGISPNTKVLVALGLSSRDQKGLEKLAQDTNTPGSALFGRHLDLAEIATLYGASAGDQKKAIAAAKRLGLDVSVDATGGMLLGEVSALGVKTIFKTDLKATKESDGATVVAPASRPKLPKELRGVVGEIVGLSGTLKVPKDTTPQGRMASASDCNSAVVGSGKMGLTEVLKAYETDALYAEGASGEGAHIGILAIEDFVPQTLETVRRCYQWPPAQSPSPTVKRVPLAVTLPPGAESALDTIIVSLIAPAAKVTVIEYDSGAPVVFPLAYALGIGRNGKGEDGISVLTSSITYCEKGLSKGVVALSEYILAAAAASGVTVVGSAGDTGSSGCYPPDKKPRLRYPPSSAYVTAVGGTQFRFAPDAAPDTGGLAGAGSSEGQAPSSILDEVVWNQKDNGQDLASGGGSSKLFAMPWYQDAAGISGKRRQVPDVAILGDPRQVSAIPVCVSANSCYWVSVAGTSADAPAFAALVALIGSRSGQLGKYMRLGLVNPAIYHLASDPQTRDVLYDVTVGTNDLFGVGCCEAKKGYDLASGWGSLYGKRFADAFTELLRPR